MNKRQEQKSKTRLLLLKTARTLFIKNGFLKTTTAEIAKSAEVAHGTLFLHFRTKESLILAIMDDELDNINNSINTLIIETEDFSQLLGKYLDLMEASEDLFAVLAREMPFYPEELRRRLLFRESIIRSHFHDLLQQGIDQGIYPELDIITTLAFFFSYVNYLLANKVIFVESGSVISKFKKKIITTFQKMIQNKEK